MSAHSGPARAHGPRALMAVVVLVPVLAGLALAAFAWPAARLAPRDLPVGVVAPAAAVAAIEAARADGDARTEGPRRAARFTWEESARLHWEAYERALAHHATA